MRIGKNVWVKGENENMRKIDKYCKTCKHYSRLMDFDTHTYCRSHRCIYCEENADRICPDYKKGENDGGKMNYEYEND